MEIVDKIPEGAVRMHFGSAETCWKPRGSMMKNSLGETLLERLEANYSHWTDSAYGDSLELSEAVDVILHGFNQEVEAARDAFLAKHPVVCGKCHHPLIEGHCSNWECESGDGS